MTVAAHQPNFIPNLAFFNKMVLADQFIIIGNLQFEKHEGWQQRHKIPGPQNDLWLTVPVLGSQNQLIRDVKINNSVPWNKKHAKTLQSLYAKTSEKDFLAGLIQLYAREWESLFDLNAVMIEYIAQALDISTPIIRDTEVEGVKHTLIINICKKYNATAYLSGLGAKSYLTDERLQQIEDNGYQHKYVTKNLTAQYPYSTIHYILTKGREWVKGTIA